MKKQSISSSPSPSPSFYLDGIPIRLIPKDLDHDGIVGGIENIRQQGIEEQDIMQQSELKEVISELNEDKLSSEGMSQIDMKTILTQMEKTAYHSFDALITMKFLPKSASSISRIGKRLNVSTQDGIGRRQIVDIVGRQQEKKKTSLDNMGLSMGKAA